MHDKYYYEAAEMALIDTDVRRTFATGIAGFSHVVDSLCCDQVRKGKGCPRRERHGDKLRRQRVISRVTETMMTVRMISQFGC